MTIRAWRELTTVEVAALTGDQTVAVLPLGAIEQHGPHLPLGTDELIAGELVARLEKRSLNGGTALILPPLPFGESTEHQDFAGTITVDAETLIALWTAVGRSVHRAGVRRLMLLNTHGGQGGLAEIVALRLRAAHQLLAVVANSYHLPTPEGAFSASEKRYGLHGGAIETAVIQACRPELVRKDMISTFTSKEEAMAAAYTDLSAVGRARFGWMAQDLHPEGVTGDALAATPELGQATLVHMTDRLVCLLDDMLRFDLNDLQPGPLPSC